MGLFCRITILHLYNELHQAGVAQHGVVHLKYVVAKDPLDYASYRIVNFKEAVEKQEDDQDTWNTVLQYEKFVTLPSRLYFLAHRKRVWERI